MRRQPSKGDMGARRLVVHGVKQFARWFSSSNKESFLVGWATQCAAAYTEVSLTPVTSGFERVRVMRAKNALLAKPQQNTKNPAISRVREGRPRVF